jgi:hypothetical protein
MMRVFVPMLMLVWGMAAVGCKKSDAQPKGNSAVAAQTEPAPNDPAAPQPNPSIDPPVRAVAPPAVQVVIPVTPSDPGNMEKTLADLTQALRKYSFERRQMPRSFSEVIAAGYVQPVPQAPPGKKFEIDPKTKHVALMKQ